MQKADIKAIVKNLNKEDILKFLVLVLGLNDSIIRLIDNFDFTGFVPKIVIYLENISYRHKNRHRNRHRKKSTTVAVVLFVFNAART